jgi:alpha-L-rhamnosidase
MKSAPFSISARVIMWLPVAVAIALTGCRTISHLNQSTKLQPVYLRCEYRVDPLGIDVTEPRLSWQVESKQRGERQTACEILVASSPELLAVNRGDLWDSGKFMSDETVGTVYAGRPLVSQEHCYWKVRVWDQAGHATWSQPAQWSMGLLQPSDWRAEWIGHDAVRLKTMPRSPLESADWIWFAPDGGNPPQGDRVFRKDITLPNDVHVKQAELTATADDSFQFAINHKVVLASKTVADSWHHSQSADVTQEIHPGINHLLAQGENAAVGPAGLMAILVITTDGGQVFKYVTDGTWQATVSPGTNWVSKAVETNSWSNARVIGKYGVSPWGSVESDAIYLPPASYLRTTFRADPKLVRATIYASALGLADVYLNGQRVSKDFFTPGWTDYDRRVHYRTYDVTKLMRQGENALGAVLADGWYSGYIGYAGQRDYYGKLPRVRIQLQLDYADGSHQIIGTGSNWKATTGPVLEADFLKGETYDARKELAGWNEPGYDDTDWQPVVTGSEVQPLMQADPGQPIRVIAEFKAKTISEPKPGVYVMNLGQNFAGIARLKISGHPGQKITLQFAERLNPDGTVYTANLRTARSTDTYVCKGGGVEVWEPHFTYHGFQYVQVTGLTEPPTKDTVVGLALSSDTPVAGSFHCSDPMLNQLHSNIYWTQRANFMDIPTDCPQRDERLGWTGDAQVYIRTATLNCDVEAFFTKWLVDLITDGQREDGEFPMVAPVKVAGDDGGPAWADAGVICPWTLYEVYGDRRILETYYPAMTRFIAFCQNRSHADLLPPDQYQCFGDWLNIHADTPKDVICTAYFAYSTKLTARAAEVLGKTDDAAKYNELFNRIKAAFNRAYVSEDGRIKGDTQTDYVLALAFDLVDGERARLAGQHLVDNIEKCDWHLSTGFIGTKDLMLALAKIGRDDVADRLIFQDTFPSWGFSIKQGATSIWERWDGWTPQNGFQDPSMNSFAHYSFGAVYQWMVENIGGIRTDGPAYKHNIIAPQINSKLTSATTSYVSIRGPIKTAWQRSADKLILDVTIPANTTATVYLPLNFAKGDPQITESRKPIDRAQHVKLLRTENNRAVLEIGSGSYHFEVENRP